MLRDWLAADFLCDVFIIVLRLVSVAILWFAHALVFPVVGYALLPAVGYDLLPAVACALLPAVNYALSDCFHPCSKSSMLFSCGPRALVSFSLLATTGSLAWFCLYYSFFWRGLHQHYFGIVYCSEVRLMHLQRHFSACAASSSLFCGKCSGSSSLQFGTTWSAVCEVWLLFLVFWRFVAAAVRRCSSTPLCDTPGCALVAKAFIKASCRGVVLWFVQHRKAYRFSYLSAS